MDRRTLESGKSKGPDESTRDKDIVDTRTLESERYQESQKAMLFILKSWKGVSQIVCSKSATHREGCKWHVW